MLSIRRCSALLELTRRKYCPRGTKSPIRVEGCFPRSMPFVSRTFKPLTWRIGGRDSTLYSYSTQTDLTGMEHLFRHQSSNSLQMLDSLSCFELDTVTRGPTSNTAKP